MLLNSAKFWEATLGIENVIHNKAVLNIPGNLLSKVIVSKDSLYVEKAHGIPNEAKPEAVRMGAGIIHEHQVGRRSESSKLGFLQRCDTH